MAKKYHPDINHDIDAKSKMQEINNAYEVLSDISKRREYDKKISVKENNNAYETYTKSKEESEIDLEDYLKFYLKIQRTLEKLYKLYIINEIKIIARKESGLLENPRFIIQKTLIEQSIIETLIKFTNGEQKNLIYIIIYLLERLKEPINKATDSLENHVLVQLLIAEFYFILKKVNNKEVKKEIIRFLLKKYIDLLKKSNNMKKYYDQNDQNDQSYLTPYEINLMTLLEDVINKEKDLVQSIIDENPSRGGKNK